MTTTINSPTPKKHASPGKKISDFVNKFPVHVALVAISILWTLPSIGLLISSIRPGMMC
jgi:hypothetical protein